MEVGLSCRHAIAVENEVLGVNHEPSTKPLLQMQEERKLPESLLSEAGLSAGIEKAKMEIMRELHAVMTS
jgi:hypothetical protein